MSKVKKDNTTTLTISNIHEADTFVSMVYDLLNNEEDAETTIKEYFEYGEYANIELTVNPDMTFTGKFLKLSNVRENK